MHQGPPAPVERRPRFFYGWAVVGAALLVAFADSAIFNITLSVFIRPMEEEFGWSRASIALAVTIGVLAGSVIAPLAGGWIDRYGARVFLAIGSAIIGLCIAALALVQELWQFWALMTIGRAAAISLTTMAGIVAISNWFIRRRALAVAVALTGQRLAHAVLPLVAFAIIAAAGWREAWLALGLMVLAFGVVPSLLLVRRRPEDMGLLPDGDTPEGARRMALRGPAGGDWTRPEAVRSVSLWLLTVGGASFALVGGSINLHLAPYLQDQGLPAQAAVNTLAVFAVTAAVSSLSWGWMSERLGVRAALALCLGIGGFVVLYLLTVASVAGALLFGVLYGSVFGGAFTLTQVIVADYFGRTHVGAIRGIMTPFTWLLNAVGPVVAGLVFDTTGSYVPVFIAFTIASFVGCAAIAAAPKPERRASGQGRLP